MVYKGTADSDDQYILQLQCKFKATHLSCGLGCVNHYDRWLTQRSTGGLGGAGTAIAKALISDGGYVVLFDVIEQSAGEQAASKHGSRVKYVKCDITNEDDTRRAVKTAAAAFEGKLSGVVHCAGVALAQPWTNRICDHIQRFKKMIDINTVGTFIVNGLVADAINERYEPEKMAKGEFFTTKEERGVIINFSSVAKDGIARVLCYGPTKAGSHGVGVAMSDFLAPSGRCTGMCEVHSLTHSQAFVSIL